MDTTSVWRAAAPQPVIAMLQGDVSADVLIDRRRHHRRHAGAAAGPSRGRSVVLLEADAHRQRQHRQLDRQPVRNAEPGPARASCRSWDARRGARRSWRSGAPRSTSSRSACSQCRRAASAAAPLSCMPSRAAQRRTSVSKELAALSQAGCARARCDSRAPPPLPPAGGRRAGAAGPGAVPAAGLRGAPRRGWRPRRARSCTNIRACIELDHKARRAVDRDRRGEGAGDRPGDAYAQGLPRGPGRDAGASRIRRSPAR